MTEPRRSSAQSGGAKKKWSKGKVREKTEMMVLFDQKTYDRLFTEIPKVRRGSVPCSRAVAQLTWRAGRR